MITTMTYDQYKDEYQSLEWSTLRVSYEAKYDQLSDSALTGDFILDYERLYEKPNSHGYGIKTVALFEAYYRARYSSDDRQALLNSFYPEFAAQYVSEQAALAAKAEAERKATLAAEVKAACATRWAKDSKSIGKQAKKSVKTTITYAWAFVVRLGKAVVCEMLGIASDVKTNYMQLCSQLHKQLNKLV